MKQTLQGDEAPQPVSMVLLLRRPANLSPEDLRTASQRAWDVSFSDEKGRNFISSSGDRALVAAGPHLINLTACTRPYLSDNPEAISGKLSQSSQQKAWADHSAWISLDYLQGGANPELEYCVLARLAAAMIDDNCCGLYVPRESSFAPNDGSLIEALLKIASSGNTSI